MDLVRGEESLYLPNTVFAALARHHTMAGITTLLISERVQLLPHMVADSVFLTMTDCDHGVEGEAGVSGGIGQPLSMLLKLNPAVTKLNLYDIVHTPGVAADLSRVETKAATTGFVGADQLEASLVGAETVVIPAGVPRKPGMARDDPFNTNASIVAIIAAAGMTPHYNINHK